MLMIFAETFLIATRMEPRETRMAKPVGRAAWLERVRRWLFAHA